MGIKLIERFEIYTISETFLFSNTCIEIYFQSLFKNT